MKKLMSSMLITKSVVTCHAEINPDMAKHYGVATYEGIIKNELFYQFANECKKSISMKKKDYTYELKAMVLPFDYIKDFIEAYVMMMPRERLDELLKDRHDG